MEALSLYELNNLVRSTLECTLNATYWVKAEMAEARMASNGHFYCEFVQKDTSGTTFLARARGVIWARTYHLLAPLFERATGERLRAGLTVLVEVEPEFHEVYGFSLKVVNIDPSFTMGDMARRRHEILAQLGEAGIIDDNKTLPMPALLRNIAVVSSATAAGYGDFCHQLENNPYGLRYRVRLFPASMQGAAVVTSVMEALERIAADCQGRETEWHCVVIIRGGGATSDLADFEDFNLAAAVAQMPVPVIVGIGHERDETVLDFVAHTRVKTPTAAAAFIIEHGAAQLACLQEIADSLRSAATQIIATHRHDLEHLTALLPRIHAVLNERQARRLDALATRTATATQRVLWKEAQSLERTESAVTTAVGQRLQREGFFIQAATQRLTALDPALMLRRGYSLTYMADGRLVRSVAELTRGSVINTHLADGIVTAIVTDSLTLG